MKEGIEGIKDNPTKNKTDGGGRKKQTKIKIYSNNKKEGKENETPSRSTSTSPIQLQY
jgi:hypothetical protein